MYTSKRGRTKISTGTQLRKQQPAKTQPHDDERKIASNEEVDESMYLDEIIEDGYTSNKNLTVYTG
ncbi:MAG: hypothetical protein K2X81_01935, partial [Candidatus Obscuribacterales bacterium]|nr:hypothetical protein [Candidatus Obscuribacterales bacterium]